MRKTFSILFCSAARALVCVLALVAPSLVFGQAGIGDIVYTVGTSVRDVDGRDWAYIMWQGTDAILISNKVFAIYAKPGDATNNAPFARISIVSRQNDARVIEPLLKRAENLGDDIIKMQDDLQQLFGSIIPTNTISRADQLSSVMRGSQGNPEYYKNLLVLARNHAGIEMALGFSDAELINPGLTTFEVRVFDLNANTDIAVIGRVTVEAGNPTVLTPPGPPVLVPDDSPKGDLNLKFRWGTPDELRRLGLIQFGYNLYRISKPLAIASNWDASHLPPIPVLTNLIVTQPGDAKLVNRAPIIPGKLFTEAEASDFTSATADTNTMFIMDDDGRGRPGYVNMGFTNGAEYYYYASARDVLGRDGMLSPGYLATVCDRMPPLPPRGVHVINEYSYDPITETSNQFLRIRWAQAPNTNDVVTNYWIYRWTNLVEMNALSGDYSNNLVAVVPYVPGATNNSYLDNGAGSPTALSAYGETYWYTVRAGDSGACGQNLSGAGGPAWGVLRNRNGPGPGNGYVEINCTRPIVTYLTNSFIKGSDPTNYDMDLICASLSSQFEWAEFYAIITYTFPVGTTFIPPLLVTNTFPRLYYLGGPVVSTLWSPSRFPDGPQVATAASVQIWCRAGLSNGKVSDWAIADPPVPGVETRERVIFEALLETDRVAVGPPSTVGNFRNDCRHDPTGGGGGVSGTNNIIVHVFPSAGSTEYRIYRRVDEGPLSLLCQGAVSNILSAIDCFENEIPVNGGTICFYVQFLDVNGNPGPMTPIGCVDSDPVTPLPTPVLAKITAVGSSSSPSMNISWFCAPYGVDRFELRMAGLPTGPNTNAYALAAQLSYTGAPPASMVISNFGTNLTLPFYSYITPKVGPGFGNNGAQFTIPANVELGKTYIVLVRALAQGGTAGPFSDSKTFLWSYTNAPTITVPWPARPAPSTNANLPGLAYFLSPTNGNTALLTANYTGNAVLLAIIPLSPNTGVSLGRGSNAKEIPPEIGTDLDPNTYIGTNSLGDSYFPCALYRYQVPSFLFPTVSGTMLQVSPLMENMAYARVVNPGVSTNTVLVDPFMVPTVSRNDFNIFLWLWLEDTQPVVAGARYRYVLAHFNKVNHEIDQLIPTTEVDVP